VGIQADLKPPENFFSGKMKTRAEEFILVIISNLKVKEIEFWDQLKEGRLTEGIYILMWDPSVLSPLLL